jgi:hypothetical protein
VSNIGQTACPSDVTVEAGYSTEHDSSGVDMSLTRLRAARHEPWARRKRPIKKESVLTDGNQVLRERALEWIAAGLVALFIFSGIVFYSFSVDAEHKRDATKCGGEGIASALATGRCSQ